MHITPLQRTCVRVCLESFVGERVAQSTAGGWARPPLILMSLNRKKGHPNPNKAHQNKVTDRI